LFFTFGFLAIFPLIGGIIAIELKNNKDEGNRSIIKIGLGSLIGFLISHIIFSLSLNYNVFQRYSNSMSNHVALRGWSWESNILLENLSLNFLEFFIWLGIPFSILFIYSFVKGIMQVGSPKISNLSIFTFFLGFTIISTNILGKTITEVARLWMFFIPLMSISVASEIIKLKNNLGRWALIVLFGIQYYSIVQIKEFMDFFYN
jgi:hypothetical protein